MKDADREQIEALIDDKLARVFAAEEEEERRIYSREEQRALKQLAGLRVQQAIQARRRADKCRAPQ